MWHDMGFCGCVCCWEGGNYHLSNNTFHCRDIFLGGSYACTPHQGYGMQ
ncbi:hypothetical protein APS_1560 [Acetobacter pasteurianus subsp. pasteurianus LMG 1262 = NBRC 106471]|nr:hypothetical protein APS_1560 [Acetobacter pasteurianus subsp. pasteurianus LMG 1262 = NBRC 106471]